MRLSDFFNELRTRQPRPDQGPPATGSDPVDLERARRLADEWLSAADDAIRRALSGDSEKFLQATRQSGGQ
mgnify:CR=1 FL=1